MVNACSPVTIRRSFRIEMSAARTKTGGASADWDAVVPLFNSARLGTKDGSFNRRFSMTKTITFDEAYDVADMLIKRASKDQLAECARLLALNLAYHQVRQGEIPVDETLALLRSFELNDEQLTLLMEGMLNLIGVLVNVCGGVTQARH